jgi:hypothetical protein
MARRGASYQQILTKYFPTTHVERKKCKGAGDLTEPRADRGPQPGSPAGVVAAATALWIVLFQISDLRRESKAVSRLPPHSK